VLKVRVHSDDLGIELTVDVVREQAAQLQLRVGDAVFVSPRNVRVFLPSDFTI
jgi:sulfate transport system ATP-binding protein